MARNIEEKLAKLSTDEILAWCVTPRGGNHMAARVLNQCALTYDNTIPTLQVELGKRGQLGLRVNTEFFRGLSIAGKKFAVKHEAYHLAAFHLFRFTRLLDLCTNDKMRRALVAVNNIAADAETHDAYMRDDPDYKKVVETGEMQLITPQTYDLPRNLTYEEYVAMSIMKIPEIAAKLKLNSKGGGTITIEAPGSGSGGSGKGKPTKNSSGTGKVDDEEDLSKNERKIRRSLQEMAEKYSDLFEKLNEYFKSNNGGHSWAEELAEEHSKDPEAFQQKVDAARQQTRQMVRQAIRDTERSRGLVPLGLQGMYKDLLDDPQVHWTEMFKDWLSTNVINQLEETIAMPNLALLGVDWCEPYPGMCYTTDFTIAWLTDTSGSMQDAEFIKAVSEVNFIMATNKRVKVHMIQIDTAIHHEMLVSQIDWEPPNRYGYGGTRLAAAIRRFMGDEPENGDLGDKAVLLENPPTKHEAMIIYTDAYIEDLTEARAKFPGPVVWLITTDATPRGVDPHKDTLIRITP
jgi:predicted metal-dependent peptidase